VSNRISRTHTPTPAQVKNTAKRFRLLSLLYVHLQGFSNQKMNLREAHWLNKRLGFAARTYVPPFKAEAETHSA
jgi:hypothetical protein